MTPSQNVQAEAQDGRATVGRGRRSNADLVLGYVWSADVSTVTDVMAACGLTRATVHSIFSDLVEWGWVHEQPSQREAANRTGRPARRFTLAADAGQVLGVDVGEHSIKVALADLRGDVIAHRSVHDLTASTTARARLHHVGRLARDVTNEVPAGAGRVLATSVGVAAPVDGDGHIGFRSKSPVQYDEGFRLDREDLTAAVGGGPLLLANDANLAVLGERWRGHARGVDNVVALLCSERLGAGVVDSGRLVLGRDGAAGEMYFLDHVAGVGAAHGVAMMARQWATEAQQCGRRTIIGDDAHCRGSVTAEAVFSAAAQGDVVAMEVLERLADRFARVCGILSTVLNPELVVFCGGVALAMEPLADAITERLRSLTYGPPRIACSTLGDAIVTTGAIRLALDHVQEHALDDTRAERLLR